MAASRLDPITVPFALPLALRITFFIVTVALGVYFNKQPWHSTDLKKPYMREFGIFTGGLTALIWTSAASVFWQDYIGEAGTAPAGPFGVMNGLVGILPDVRTFVPFFMLAFVLFLIIVIVTKLPTLFKP
ncbi:MAG: hypothetical protein HC893_14570 [Chloroflexaceae bacterium]|nr:hypothetical protein [Chloroflexaceae bacterium]